MIKYIGIYLLLGIICNVGLAFGIVIYTFNKVNFDDKAMSDIMDIMLNTQPGSGIGKAMSNMVGSQKWFGYVVFTQLIWPVNVAILLERLPYALDYIRDFNNK